MKTKFRWLVPAVIGLIVLGLNLVSPGVEDQPPPSSPVEATVSGLPAIAVDQLPAEALKTLSLIDTNGPYPFDRDDLVFQNREGLLPPHPRGHYREYTVITPGEDDRGARRIVAGDDGELYYTADHYRSFREIVSN